jgi:hypothetical protein
MDLIKIKVNCENTNEEKKVRLISICASLSVKLVRIFPINGGYSLTCSTSSEADKLFSVEAATLLGVDEFRAVMPPQIIASRTLLLYNLDEMILAHDPEVIKNELESKNPWCRVAEVYKFSTAKGVKVLLGASIMADKSLTLGLLLFQLHIPGSMIRRDNYYPILTCYKCFQLEDHKSMNCPKDDGYKICSICSSTDHTWKSCKSLSKQCINCNGDHNSLSMKCSKRKEILASKRNGVRNKNMPKTFSSVTASAHVPVPVPYQPVPVPYQLEQTVMAQVFTCVSVAMFKNMETPGTFTEVLSHLLTLNNLPVIKMDLEPPRVSTVETTNSSVDCVLPTDWQGPSVTPDNYLLEIGRAHV